MPGRSFGRFHGIGYRSVYTGEYPIPPRKALSHTILRNPLGKIERRSDESNVRHYTIGVHVGLPAHGLLQPARRNFRDGHRRGLPVLARGVSMHAWGLRLRRVLRMLAITHPSVLPSAMLNDVGTPVAIISQLNTRPACAPVNASMAASRFATHDSGSGWIAIPFLYDSFIHNSTPVYPGALSSLLRRSNIPTTFTSLRR